MMDENLTTAMINKDGTANKGGVARRKGASWLGDHVLVHGQAVSGRQVILFQDTKGGTGSMSGRRGQLLHVGKSTGSTFRNIAVMGVGLLGSNNAWRSQGRVGIRPVQCFSGTHEALQGCHSNVT